MDAWKPLALSAICLFITDAVLAKLPPPNEEQIAKVALAKEKAADAAKKDAELLAKSQDRVVSHYVQQQKAKGVTAKSAPIVIAPPTRSSSKERLTGGPTR